MSYHGYTRKFPLIIQQQADAVLNQANPVSATLYEWAIGGVALGNQPNVRIINFAANITWAVTQPTPLDVVVTIDGITMIFRVANPVSTQNYKPRIDPINTAAIQALDVTSGDWHDMVGIPILEGRSAKVEVRITWAVTQPTPLVLRVKWAKW